MSRQKFTLEVNPTLPPSLGRLAELATNLRFSWHRPTRRLFETLDAHLWAGVGGNPRLFLRCIDQSTLDAAAVSTSFLDDYHQVLRGFDAYLEEPRPEAPSEDLEAGDLIAYFCAEYGFHESFPNYSGGLGILAGDHCKTASDMALNFVAVGLLYRQGYFIQTLDADGNQVPQYRDFTPDDLPVESARDASGRPIRVTIRIDTREVIAQLWRAQVGRVTVVLLDTNVAENSEADRAITHKLYGGDREVRIQQEMILGIGGVRALRALGLAPTVWHINEGHAAFLGIELMCELIERGVSFAAAREAVASACVFTTHTSVAAGHDSFAPDLVLRHFVDYARRLQLDAGAFLTLGRNDPAAAFDMTFLALTLSRHRNGVSRIHGQVSSQICAPMWPEVPAEDNPVGYVTNGVHVPTFMFQRWKDLFDSRFGRDWRSRMSDPAYWEKIAALPDSLFWELKQGLKTSMLSLVRTRLRQGCQRNQVSDAHFHRLARWIDPENPRVLTVGFARRFATYKRSTLLFRDPGLLASIVGDAERPVAFIFAGKAHPADEPSRQMIREVHAMAQRPEFLGRVLFIEDYDVGLARTLVAGVDVWLNNPVYPLEACGTSGMKAAINGTINLSVLDGWWAEGFDGQNGWAIPSSTAEGSRRDDEDARSLYEILQDEVVPMYYERDASGLPKRWITRAKRSMATLLGGFNSRRMVGNYVTGLYRPAAAQGRRLATDGCRPAEQLAAWSSRARAAWPLLNVRAISARPERVGFGDRVRMRVAVNLNGLSPADVRVELLLTRELPDGPFERPRLTSFGETAGHARVRGGREAAIELFAPSGEREPDGAHVFAIECTPPWCGRLGAEVRVVPYHELLSHPYELGLMRWL
ncbi:MAG TPA: alpha-glucan family phosphorylase [Steroidobacteraceae bacterium]|nr:alpha-glucan family phosphorylase [Steroidobacteraceae bacterium]